jgi:hypothetical protein
VNVAALEKLIKKKPFDPFEIVLSSGDRYVVAHPENCMLLKEAVFVAFATSPKEMLPDDFAFLSYLHIAATERVNGKRKAR